MNPILSVTIAIYKNRARADKRGQGVKTMNKERIKAKVILGLPLSARERAVYLLLIASVDEMREFLAREAADNGND